MGVAYKDLREWMDIVNGLGALRYAHGISLEDVGRIAELSALTPVGPTLVLDNFNGFEKGRRILLNPYGSAKQIAVTFGLPITDNKYELMEAFKNQIEKIDLIPPKIVQDGPILENVLEGENIDLMGFPVPKWHEADIGPYIGTGSLVITKDLDEEWVNVATNRIQRHSKNQVGWYVSPGHHGSIHRNKYFQRGEKCPVVAVVGSDPLLFSASMLELPFGMSELDWVGGWREEPIPVIKGKFTGLPIPANAEIAIEGFVDQNCTLPEGPFGEWTGYYASRTSEQPVIDVKAVYFRNNPILLGMPPEKPPFDADKCREYIKSALLTNQLKKQGIPGIVNAWCYGVGGCRLLIAISIKQQYPGHASQVGHAAYATPYGNHMGRYVIVVDEDIDVTDLQDLVWAVLTRTDPINSIDFVRTATSSVIDPYISPADKLVKKLFTSRAIINATKPYDWKEEFPKTVSSSNEYLNETRKQFGYLLK